MKNNHLITQFSIFSLLSITSIILLFQNTTTTANVISVPQYTPFLGERNLETQNCQTLPNVALGLNKQNCNMISRIECDKIYKVQTNFQGDTYTYNNCLNQCIRNAREQCLYASSTNTLTTSATPQ